MSSLRTEGSVPSETPPGEFSSIQVAEIGAELVEAEAAVAPPPTPKEDSVTQVFSSEEAYQASLL
jgi:hypothetical protein